jgi:hypothetical protein
MTPVDPPFDLTVVRYALAHEDDSTALVQIRLCPRRYITQLAALLAASAPDLLASLVFYHADLCCSHEYHLAILERLADYVLDADMVGLIFSVLGYTRDDMVGDDARMLKLFIRRSPADSTLQAVIRWVGVTASDVATHSLLLAAVERPSRYLFLVFLGYMEGAPQQLAVIATPVMVAAARMDVSDPPEKTRLAVLLRAVAHVPDHLVACQSAVLVALVTAARLGLLQFVLMQCGATLEHVCANNNVVLCEALRSGQRRIFVALASAYDIKYADMVRYDNYLLRALCASNAVRAVRYILDVYPYTRVDVLACDGQALRFASVYPDGLFRLLIQRFYITVPELRALDAGFVSIWNEYQALYLDRAVRHT